MSTDAGNGLRFDTSLSDTDGCQVDDFGIEIPASLGGPYLMVATMPFNLTGWSGGP